MTWLDLLLTPYLIGRYHRDGKTLHLRHFSPGCSQLMRNARGRFST